MDLMSTAPAVLSINEACYSQMVDLYTYFNSRGWTMGSATFTQNPSVGPCGNTIYGAWAFAPGTGYTPTPFTYQYQNQNTTPNGEPRGVACISGGTNSPKWIGCTTHLQKDAGTVSVKRQQFVEFQQTMTYLNGTHPTTSGGDLYLKWSNITAIAGQSSFFASWKEAGRCVSPYNELWTLEKASFGLRYDHMISPSNLACTSNGLVDPNVSSVPTSTFRSDHRLVTGQAAAF